MKKLYTSPHIKRVTLTAEQSILNVCAVAGSYMSTGGTACVKNSFLYGGARQCALSVKGQSNPVVGQWTAENAPS